MSTLNYTEIVENAELCTADSIFKKFIVIQKFLSSCTFGRDWDKNSKSGLNFEHLRKKKGWKFDLKIFFSHKNGIWDFSL